MVVKSVCKDSVLHYPLQNITDRYTTVFLDIETTGFSAKSSSLYLIGCLYFSNDVWNLIQWFAKSKEEEQKILVSFKTFLKDYKTVIHFNGQGFDLPYLAHKFTQYKLINPLEIMESIDLYKNIRPYKTILKLENLKQKTIERFIGIHREDTYSGGDLISIYKEYTVNPNEEWKRILLLHNQDDMFGMLRILPVLFYDDFFRGDFNVSSIHISNSRDMYGNDQLEGIMELDLKAQFPVSISYGTESLYLKIKGNKALLKFPCVQKELKFFFENYKEYYYLPEEDLAIHKSVSSYVSKEHRIQAKAATCYTRKSGLFLPQNKPLFSPVFKNAYSDSYTYFELTDELICSDDNKLTYGRHLLDCLLHGTLFQ